jgi:serine/threonine protein kinase
LTHPTNAVRWNRGKTIEANQFLLKDGMYRLNDFNLGDFLRWNTTSQQYCQFESGYEGRWQAPEQAIEGYRHKSERSDIFSLGYVFYFLLTGMKPFEGTAGSEVQQKVLNGRLPVILEEIRNSTHPFDIAMRTAIGQCFSKGRAAAESPSQP